MNQPFDPRPISKATRTERRKLSAVILNTIGLAIFGIGVITPIISPAPDNGSVLTFVAFGAIFLIFHLAARRMLRGLED